jgi:hypothetical protein
MAELDKEKVAKVLSDAGTALRSMAAERDKLAARCSILERHAEAQKLATAMHEKGLNRDVDYETLVQDLEKAAEAGRLPVIQEAVEMVGPNMGFTGTLSNDDVPAGGGSSAFENFILGDVG